MTSDIGTMDTPPYGTSLYPDTEVTPVETPAKSLPKPAPQVPTAVEDIFVLGRWFAKPRNWATGALPSKWKKDPLTYYFRTGQQNYLSIAGGIDLNNRFMVPLRQLVAGREIRLRDFHGFVGRLGISFFYPDAARDIIMNYDAWHNVLLRSFFVEMLAASNPTAGDTLVGLWVRDIGKFVRATSQLRTISTHSLADDHMRAAALRVFGHTAQFFAKRAKGSKIPECPDTFRQGTVEHLEFFQAHKSPFIATAAMFSLRMIGRILR